MCTSAAASTIQGFAKTILLVEPEQPFLGTVRLEALPYRHVDISTFYPYGDVRFP